jgi:uncharacterized protein
MFVMIVNGKYTQFWKWGYQIMFSSKKDKFFELLSSISNNLVEGAKYFVDYKIKNAEDLVEFAKTMDEFEHKGDTYIHELIVLLNKTFITPIEREDILALANKMDDVLDGLEQCASRFDLYQMTQADEYMIKFVDNIYKSTIEINEATQLLAKKKLVQIHENSIKINDYESVCDKLTMESIKNLFQTEKDPIKIIQYKELYETLEAIADSCEDVADTFETIIMRNA